MKHILLVRVAASQTPSVLSLCWQSGYRSTNQPHHLASDGNVSQASRCERMRRSHKQLRSSKLKLPWRPWTEISGAATWMCANEALGPRTCQRGLNMDPRSIAIGGYGGAGGAAGSGAGGAGTHGLVLRGKCSRMHVKRVHRQTSRDPQLHRLEARGKRHRRNHRVLSLRWRQKTRGGAFSQCCAFGNLCSGRGGDRYRSCCRCQESFRGSSRSCRGQHCKRD